MIETTTETETEVVPGVNPEIIPADPEMPEDPSAPEEMPEDPEAPQTDPDEDGE